MPAVTCGAELVKRLKASGTPPGRLAAARELLLRVHEAEGRVASAPEVCEVLERELGPDNGTVRKAKVIAEAGVPVPPKPNELPAEEIVLAAGRNKRRSAEPKGDADEKPVEPKKPDAEPAKAPAKKAEAKKAGE